MFDKRVIIICGFYGSGKSEVISNIAFYKKMQYNNLTICDLDIINPYFRSSELATLFSEHNITLTQGFKGDLPALPGNIFTKDPTHAYLIDLGGGTVGVQVLNVYRDNFLAPSEFDFFIVVNTNRPETTTLEQTQAYLISLENASNQKITGIISNTHMLAYTTKDDILQGYKICKQLSVDNNIPLVAVTFPTKYVKKEELSPIQDPLFPIDTYLREGWM